MTLPLIAVFSGPSATIANCPDLVTSNKARIRHGLPLHTTPDGRRPKFDALRPQRLAAPVTVYIEAFTAHPLEADAADLSAPPDGWLDESGTFVTSPPSSGGTPVYSVELRPEDGLYPLPYMGRQADGSAWDAATAFPYAPRELARQTFYPDASRIYEEIERFGLHDEGHGVALWSVANFDFIRATPSGGYTNGLASEQRSDLGGGDIGREELGRDYFVYYPYHLACEPSRATLARSTNIVQSTLDTGRYIGAQWLEASPTIEETMYWLGLLVDTTAPLVGHAAQRRHQGLSADGDRNIVDGVKFLTSSVALDDAEKNMLGAVVVVDELVYSAREFAKVDARPGGYEATGGHGGIVADMGGYGAPRATHIPAQRHTHCSDVRLTVLPESVTGVTGTLGNGVKTVRVTIKDANGMLVPDAMPTVSISKYSHYARRDGGPFPDPEDEVEILARIEANLADAALSGFVCEGMSPYGMSDASVNAALTVAIYAGMPVARVGRGNTGGMAYKTDPAFIAASNLTATKARMLMMAALLKYGALPPAANPFAPTPAEMKATNAAVAQFQLLFDTH